MWSVSRFPQWKLTFRNAGIGGDRSTGGNSRFARDVLIHKPTAMTVDFGMNDGGYRPFDEAGFKTYMGGLQGMAKQAQDAKIRVAWVTPSPVEKPELGPALAGYNETLEKYSAGVQQIATSSGGLFIDQFHPFVATIDKARAADPKNRIGGGDAVHPGSPGQALMAWAILKGLHFPSQVSDVAIDAASGQLVAAQNCKVTDVSASADGVRFQRLDSALPFFPAEAQSILKWVPIRDELNQYGLKVSGLKPGNYEVRLDGKSVATHSAAELAAGVNLAAAVLAQGPVADQVKSVWGAVVAKNKYYHDQIFRGIVLAQVNVPDYLGLKLSPAEIQAKRESAMAERMAKMPELDAAVRKALEMKSHQLEIVAAK
jgi:lysophospholipase L1-like esterase